MDNEELVAELKDTIRSLKDVWVTLEGLGGSEKEALMIGYELGRRVSMLKAISAYVSADEIDEVLEK